MIAVCWAGGLWAVATVGFALAACHAIDSITHGWITYRKRPR